MIRYETHSTRIGDSEDCDINLTVHLDERAIGRAGEGENLEIDGDFRNYIETGKIDKDGIPEFEHKSFSLSVQDIINLQRIMLWWVYETEEEPKDLQKAD